MKTLGFPDLLRLIDERSTAFRAAIAAAPRLDAPVPTCPDWTLHDLARHLGDGRRKWAAIVAAGPAATPPDTSVWQADPAPHDREALLDWLAQPMRQLTDTLRQAGPDHRCWTWWEGSDSPQTSGAVARHQLQELTVHTYDAQLALGAPQPLPTEIAVDGVDEFLATCCAGPYRWPYEPAVLDYHATEGPSWRLSLAADGVRLTRPDSTPPTASIRGAAADLVLFLYSRIPLDTLKLDGDRRHFDLLEAWDPDA